MNCRIQRVGPTDLHLFENIAPEVFDEPILAERLHAYLAQATHLMLLALEPVDGGELVVGQCAAVLHLHPDKPAELYVDELGTGSTHRRRGIARLLMEGMLAWGLERGVRHGWLATESDNAPARRFYEGLFDSGEEAVLYEFDIDDG